MTIQPCSNYLYIRVRDGHNPSGLHIPDGVRVNPYGEVLAIGPDVKAITVGDKVLFMPSAFTGMDEATQTGLLAEPSVFAKYV